MSDSMNEIKRAKQNNDTGEQREGRKILCSCIFPQQQLDQFPMYPSSFSRNPTWAMTQALAFPSLN